MEKAADSLQTPTSSQVQGAVIGN